MASEDRGKHCQLTAAFWQLRSDFPDFAAGHGQAELEPGLPANSIDAGLHHFKVIMSMPGANSPRNGAASAEDTWPL
ncbi:MULTISPECIES: hypothetical protein [unclassified Streptosporangium]|uniref:hypothetical protein n=1 Tax=unclassified Streptosporangium TaxID=2632669 RepID=UPI002E28C34F|nr:MULTISPECIES: hypothetical protein [unclassified Streptosporangium]